MKKALMTLGALCALSFTLGTSAKAFPSDFGGPSLGSILASDGVFVSGAGPATGSAWKRGSDGAFVDDNGAAYAAAASNALLTPATELTTNGLYIPVGTYGSQVTVENLGGYARLLPGDDLHLNLLGGGDQDTGIVSGGNSVYFNPKVLTPFNFIVNNPAFDATETGGTGNWYSDDSLNGNPGGSDHLGFGYDKHFRIFKVDNSTPANTVYYVGLEDWPKRLSDRDFNDFVFKVTVADIPEPAFFQLGALVLGGGLLVIRRRRK